MQFSFNSGEWAPALNARVDIAKYHSGAALLRNFFVDYRGGATASPGTKYIATSVNNGASPPRLIPFQASFTVSYILEFGTTGGVGYLRFYNNGAPVLSGGTPYSIASPYASSELSGLKFAQNVNTLIICHPNHPPYILTLNSATNWTLAAITFGSTVAVPTGQSVTSTLPASTYNYAYVVTAADINGQESGPSAYAAIANLADIRNTGGSNTVTWSAVTGAASYNVYRAEIRVGAAVPVGASFGFVGNCTGLTFIDSNIVPDFSQGPPVILNPFSGTGVQSITITAPGTYVGGAAVPTVSFSGGGGSGAAAQVTLQCTGITAINSPGAGYVVGETFFVQGNTGGLLVEVISTTSTGVNALAIVNAGSISSGTLPSAPQAMVPIAGQGVGCTFTLSWGVAAVSVTSPGIGYGSPPAIAFSGGGATATATLGTPSAGNPTVPSFFDQRLVFAGPVANPQQFNLSQPGSYFNYNVTNPPEGDNAIQGNLVSGQLNTIQSLVAQPQGLIVLSDKQAWLINGGSAGAPVSAVQISANSQAYNGASYQPPIVANDNILYVQSKGSIVRDLVFNFYTQVYTGTDISVLSSHLFYGFNILEWAWAEEPFKLVWAVRNDGIMLTLTFLKEQELIAWAHRDTQGAFKSVATVTETVAVGAVDAIYVVVQRQINGATVQYIERMAELYYPTGVVDAWCVDAGISYSGSPATTFTGAQHLAGATVTGLADGVVIPPFAMPLSGTFTLGSAASRVVVGLAYTPQLQTLQIDTGEPTIQGKEKSIPEVTLRVNQTLGLSIGTSFTSLVPMKDLIRGNVGSATNTVVTDLVTGDARTILDPLWSVPGQYCIQQSYPLPASILGIIPQVKPGDTKEVTK